MKLVRAITTAAVAVGIAASVHLTTASETPTQQTNVACASCWAVVVE